MKNVMKVSPENKITRGEGTCYVIDNYITAEHSDQVSVAVSHLKGELWPTRNLVSDRIYYFLRGSGLFVFENDAKISVIQGDVLFVPAGLGYKMTGDFDAVLVNSPPFSIKNEQQFEI